MIERFRKQRAHWLTALLLSILLVSPALHSAESEPIALKDIRFWTQGEVTRVILELSGEFEFQTDRLQSPERLFFDLLSTKPKLAGKSRTVIPVGDTQVRQIRVGEAKPRVTRVVLDLENKTQFTTSVMHNPERLVIEVRGAGAKQPPEIQTKPVIEPPAPLVSANVPPVKIGKQKPRALIPPPVRKPPVLNAKVVQLSPPTFSFTQLSDWRQPRQFGKSTRLPGFRKVPGKTKEDAIETSELAKFEEPIIPERPVIQTRRAPVSGGPNSLTRALGLKIRRIVIDPGHGGHDQGSSGPAGLLEKELVLDVSRRLGKLIEEQLGSEVIYTRSDDQYIGLEQRATIANQAKADLFLSIHANSSSIRTVSGVETYYLSFTTSKQALEVASRENATSERSVFELKELLQKIALKDKVDESREFASKVLGSLIKSSPAPAGTQARNRGVKKAPFIVLIGTNMPSVLAEIGFLSNPRDEMQLKKGEPRQKLAEALMRGITQYAESLNQFQVARSGDE